jgi:hypothetical protein
MILLIVVVVVVVAVEFLCSFSSAPILTLTYRQTQLSSFDFHGFFASSPSLTIQ